jgi:eukaryotic-like serine/threonine-protein kinase
MSARVGQQIGNYRLLHLLGQGGFADVYLGEHIHLKTYAAIKILYTRVISDAGERFLIEARTVAHLEHPHIVRVMDFGIEDGIPFLVMGYAPHGTLRQRHPRGLPVALSTILPYVQQLAQALQYAHDTNVIHRDIKPENMLLGQHHEVLLSDFGISLVVQSAGSLSTKEFAGTVAYMAPEQLHGKPSVKSDQYALGVVVYEWLSGELPFRGSFMEMASQHVVAPVPSLRQKVPTVTPEVERVIMKALAKNPRDRFETIRDFAQALAAASQSEELPTRPLSLEKYDSSDGAAVSRPRWSRRAVLLGTLGLAAAGGVSWAVLSREVGNQNRPDTPTPTTGKKPHPTASATARSTPSPTPVARGTLLYTYSYPTSNIRSLAWSPDGKRIALGNDYAAAYAQVWDADTGNSTVVYKGHSSSVEGVAWAHKSQRIASGSADTTVQIWDPVTSGHLYTYTGHQLWVNRIAWSPDDLYIVSGEQSSTVGQQVNVLVWEVATGRTRVQYQRHTNGVFAVAWSHDGTRIASCGYDGTLQVWEALTGKHLSTYDSGGAFLFGLSWSLDDQEIAVGSSMGRALVINAATGKEVYTAPVDSDASAEVAWSPDGKYIVAGSDSGNTFLLEAVTGQRLYIYTNQAHQVFALAWASDSKRVVSGCSDGSVQVWEAI